METLGAHLRNLLTPYKNLLQLVKDGKADEETIRKYNLDNLNDLIAFSNSEAMEQKYPEPASEDLEDAARKYKMRTPFQYPNELHPAYQGFKAGAKWQKEQDQKELQLAEEHGILTGMNMEREKMMKDAVEADIAESFTPVSESPDIYMHGFTCVYEEKESTPYVVAPCKVKLIIIKE